VDVKYGYVRARKLKSNVRQFKRSVTYSGPALWSSLPPTARVDSL